jgi:hypothetical protein
LARHVALVHGSVKAFFRGLPTFQPRFVFLDGDHSEKGLARDLAIIEPRVPEGALLLFHDYVDIRNDDPGNEDYGVPQAIRGSWVDRDCEFAGAFGCSGLFRRVRGARGPDDGGDAPALIELIGLDRLSLRLLVSVARPVKRSALRHLRQLRGARAGSR